MKGKVNSIQTLGTVDGPGVRFVVFMQGCPLRCAYCHNPDTWSFDEGDEYTAKELLDKILRYKTYFGITGGVTVSGGEPLMQARFVSELFRLCKDNGIHTCIDTSGCLWNDDVKELLDVTDLCLLDVKMTNESDYINYIGCGIKPVLSFLKKLSQINKPTWIRHVVVKGVTNTEENINGLAEIIRGHSNIEKVELLPFKKLCLSKYENLGLDFRFKDIPETSNEEIDELKKILQLKLGV
ncbi:MAG: pyruvate formate lyase-activating protein [Clostridiales bacterium]|nr:pyruvate formate lyase-activating protein [Clostridiales bacterium]